MKYRYSLLLLSLLFVSFISDLSAQVNKRGNPLMVSYDYAQTGGSEWNYSIIKDDRGILYFGNEIQGILEFDGINWKSIEVNDNPVILDLEKDHNGIIYASGPYEFGYIEPGPEGELEYVSLSSRLDSTVQGKLGDVWDIQFFEDNLYFVCRRTVFRYNRESDLLDSLNTSDEFRTMQRLYDIDGNLIITDNRQGLLKLEGDSAVYLPNGEAFGRDYCFSVLPYDSTWCLVGTYFNGLHLYNFNTGEIRKDFVSEKDNSSLIEGQIYNGTVLSDGNFAIGTRGAGVYIFDRDGNLVELYSNEALGLHDDQIYYMYQDGLPSFSSQLWMTVVEKIYRISYNLPVRLFDNRNNITYPIRQVCEFNDNIYVGGDKGVAKMHASDSKVQFVDIEGFESQTFNIVPFSPSDGNNYLLAGSTDGLFIIDDKDNVNRFVDIMENQSDSDEPDYINYLIVSDFHDGTIYMGLNRKLRTIEYSGGRWSYRYDVKNIPGTVQYVLEESPVKLWLSTTDQDKLFTLEFIENDTLLTEYTGSEISGMQVKSIKRIGESIILVTDEAIMEFNHEEEIFERIEGYMLPGERRIIYEDVVPLGDRGVLVSAFDYRNFEYLVKPDGEIIEDVFQLLPKSYTSYLMVQDNIIWMPKQQEIYLLDLDRIGDYEYNNDVLIRKVVVGADSVLFNGVFFEETASGIKKLLKHQSVSQIEKISHSLNDITFNWSANNMESGDSTMYRFMIEGFDKEWSKWENVNYKDYTNLQHGKYKFKIEARGLTRKVTSETVYEFEILRAWYQSFIAMVVYIMLIILIIVGIIKVYTRRLINENVRLEGIVAERTKEVVRQKEELEDSIHYASRIQRAILSSEKPLKDNVEDYFILFRPRDIVSGDFYWISEKGSRLYIVAADCTGHGVPGAFMSILGISFLDEIVNKAKNTETDKILNILRKHVTDSLKQMEEGIEETKDGMDMGILVVNYEDNEIEYSGAYNPCWVVRELTVDEKEMYMKDALKIERSSVTDGKHILETIDADRMPIGISSRMDQPFRLHKQNLEKGVSYYLLSDGYSDQFGGVNGRKFLKKNLKKLVLEVQGLPMKQQRDLLEKRLLDWMGDHEQVDDILIMGVRVS